MNFILNTIGRALIGILLVLLIPVVLVFALKLWDPETLGIPKNSGSAGGHLYFVYTGAFI